MTECARSRQRRPSRPWATLTSAETEERERSFSVVTAEHRWSCAAVVEAVVSAEAGSSSWLHWLEVGLGETE